MFMLKENVTKLFRKNPKSGNHIPTRIVVNYNPDDNIDYNNNKNDVVGNDNSGTASLKQSTCTQRIVPKPEETGDIYYLLQLQNNQNNFVHYDIFNQYQTLIFNILEMPRGNKALIYHFAL